MKKILCFILVISIFFCCMSSCENTVDSDIDYQYGYDDGQAHLFESIWFALSYDDILSAGRLWETEDFSLELDSEEIYNSKDFPETHIKYDFKLKNMTIEESYKRLRMSFNIFAVNMENDLEKILSGDDYYSDFPIYGDVDGDCANGTIGLWGHDYKYLAIIIIVGDSIYKAAYDF